MLLEEIKSIQSTKTEVRKFGVMMGVILLVIGGFLFWKEKPSFLYFGIAGLAFAGIGLAAPFVLKPVYRAWMTFAVIMGYIMTRVILSIMYYGIFTPAGLLAKLLGKDLLKQRIDKNTSSYWVKVEQGPFDPHRAEQMY